MGFCEINITIVSDFFFSHDTFVPQGTKKRNTVCTFD